MARAIWSGSLSFGLVNVPVALLSAARDLDPHFRQIHEPDGAPIEVRRVCSEEDREVPWEEVGHGWELDDGRILVITEAELETVEPRRTKTIDIDEFVPLAAIDPIFFDHPYLLVPTGGEGANRAYRLLVDAMRREDYVAIGSFVLRTKETLVALRVRDGALALTTMLHHDEIRPTEPLADLLPGRDDEPSRKQLDAAVRLMEAMSCDFEPETYRDRHRQRLEALIERKRKGQEIKRPPKPEEPGVVPDLMAALEESLAKARASA